MAMCLVRGNLSYTMSQAHRCKSILIIQVEVAYTIEVIEGLNLIASNEGKACKRSLVDARPAILTRNRKENIMKLGLSPQLQSTQRVSRQRSEC